MRMALESVLQAQIAALREVQSEQGALAHAAGRKGRGGERRGGERHGEVCVRHVEDGEEDEGRTKGSGGEGGHGDQGSEGDTEECG